MRRTKFQRITALILAILLLFGGTISAAAADNSASVTDKTTSDIKALLNAISYTKYSEDKKDVPNATEEIVIDATAEYKFVAKDGTVYDQTSKIDDANKANLAYVDTFDGKKGLYLPGVGSASWITDKITSAAK